MRFGILRVGRLARTAVTPGTAGPEVAPGGITPFWSMRSSSRFSRPCGMTMMSRIRSRVDAKMAVGFVLQRKRSHAKPPSRKNDHAKISLVRHADLGTCLSTGAAITRWMRFSACAFSALRLGGLAAWRENLRFLLQTTSTRRGSFGLSVAGHGSARVPGIRPLARAPRRGLGRRSAAAARLKSGWSAQYQGQDASPQPG